MNENPQVPVPGKWKRYPSYKQSGVEWLGEVPEGWDVTRLKYLCAINPQKSEISPSSDDLEVSFLPMEKINENHTLTLDENKKLSDVWNGYTYFRENDIILAKITPCFENGKCCICRGLTNEIGFGTTELHVLRPKLDITSKYCYYLLRSQFFRGRGKELMFGTTGQKRLPEDYVTEFRQGIPSLAEQTSIATFLDRETARIDALIEKKKCLITLLEEKRAALISHAVTKGLDPDAKMKDSGSDYFGAIPLGWETINFRNIVTSSAFGPRFSSDLYAENGNVALLRTTDLDDEGNISYETLPLVKFSSEDFSGHFLKHDDLLISRSGTCGITSIFDEFHYPVLPGAFLIRFRLKPIVLPKFVKYYLNSQIGREILSSLESGCVQKNLNSTTLFQMKLPFPPIFEQARIVSYLDRESMQFTTIRKKIRESIELLLEYRSTLISATVTGKIDVRQEVAA